MWLINVNTLEMKKVNSRKIPPYTILSHTWIEDEEVTFQEMQLGGALDKPGYEKVVKCCELTKTLGLGYTWIDTCCIDKTSSAELSEDINSKSTIMTIWL
jgi:hypothetical protein